MITYHATSVEISPFEASEVPASMAVKFTITVGENNVPLLSGLWDRPITRTELLALTEALAQAAEVMDGMMADDFINVDMDGEVLTPEYLQRQSIEWARQVKVEEMARSIAYHHPQAQRDFDAINYWYTDDLVTVQATTGAGTNGTRVRVNEEVVYEATEYGKYVRRVNPGDWAVYLFKIAEAAEMVHAAAERQARLARNAQLQTDFGPAASVFTQAGLFATE